MTVTDSFPDNCPKEALRTTGPESTFESRKFPDESTVVDTVSAVTLAPTAGFPLLSLTVPVVLPGSLLKRTTSSNVGAHTLNRIPVTFVV